MVAVTMHGNPDDHLSAPITFSRLLVLLGKEHTREVESLEKEIGTLRKQLRTCGNTKTEVPQTQRQMSPASTTAPDDMPPGNDSLPTPNAITDQSPGIDWVATAMADEIAEDQYDSKPSLNWYMGELPEEFFLGPQLLEYIADTKLGMMLGLTKKYIAEWSIWWKNLREPERTRFRCLTNFVDSAKFQAFILSTIFLNAIWIFYTTEADMQVVQDNPDHYHDLDSKRFRLVFDVIFTSIYTAELFLKFLVHGWFLYMAEEWKWNLFDAVLVVFSLFDCITTVIFLAENSHRPNLKFLRALRMLKISKMMRMVRVVRWVQELRLMLDCVVNSMFHLFWCVVLICIVLIMFALLLVQGLTNTLAEAHLDNDAQYQQAKTDIAGFFDSVPHAMLSLFKATTGGEDWQDFYNICSDAGGFYQAVFLFYIAFFCIVAWNIVMSTFVEKAFKLAVPDANLMMLERRKRDLCYSKELTDIIRAHFGKDHDGVIGYAQFKDLFRDPHLRIWFKARDLDMKDGELFFHMLAAANKKQEVDVSAFVLGCMRLQGQASNIDVQALHYDIRNMHMKQHLDFVHLSQQLLQCFNKEQDLIIRNSDRQANDAIPDRRMEISV